jgi:hypothetical protein
MKGIKVLRMCKYSLDAILTGLDIIHGPKKPKYGGMVSRYIVYVHLY